MKQITIRVKPGYTFEGEGEVICKNPDGTWLRFWRSQGRMEVSEEIANRLIQERPQRFEIVNATNTEKPVYVEAKINHIKTVEPKESTVSKATAPEVIIPVAPEFKKIKTKKDLIKEERERLFKLNRKEQNAILKSLKVTKKTYKNFKEKAIVELILEKTMN